MALVYWPIPGIVTLYVEHDLQTTRPQLRQWCLRLVTGLKLDSQWQHLEMSLSGTHPVGLNDHWTILPLASSVTKVAWECCGAELPWELKVPTGRIGGKSGVRISVIIAAETSLTVLRLGRLLAPPEPKPTPPATATAAAVALDNIPVWDCSVACNKACARDWLKSEVVWAWPIRPALAIANALTNAVAVELLV